MARKIEQQMIAAILAIQANKASSNKWTKGNTEVTRKMLSPIEVRLHGNLIALVYDNALQITLAGWNTPTTRSRLTALCHEFVPSCYGVGTCKGQAELRYTVGNQPIDSDMWVTV